jgi:hypothetical protein
VPGLLEDGLDTGPINTVGLALFHATGERFTT